MKEADSELEPVLERSGNPGYLVGKPVMAGYLVRNGSREAINLPTDPNNWLTGEFSRDGVYARECFGPSWHTHCRDINLGARKIEF